MNSERIILTFDFGTQSTRCMLVTSEGRIIGIQKEKYQEPYYSKQLGYCEQSFKVYWDYACLASKRLKEMYPDEFMKAEGVTVTTFRDTFAPTDEKGNPLRDFIIWLDSRKAKDLKPLPLKQRFLFNVVGLGYALECQRRICRQTWIKQNEPEIWAKSKKYASISAIINAKLTGNLVDSIGSPIGHVPFDCKNRRWMSPKDLQWPIYNLESDKLVPLVRQGSVIGFITKEASLETGIKEGLPLIATGADKECETLGSGVMDDHSASLSFGTSVTIQYSTKRYIEPDPMLPSYTAINPELYNPEIQIFRGCWMISWFIQNFARKEQMEAEEKGISTEELLDEHLKDVPLGSSGLILLPDWNPPLKRPEARGTIIGFVPDHNKFFLYRAIIEGIGYTLYGAYKKLEKRTKHHTEYFVISGGGSQSDEICQMMADIIGIQIKRTKNSEGSGIGSSLSGFVGLGVFKTYEEGIEKMVAYKDTFKPNQDNHTKYMEIYEKVYRHVYPNIRHAYKNYLKLEKGE